MRESRASAEAFYTRVTLGFIQGWLDLVTMQVVSVSLAWVTDISSICCIYNMTDAGPESSNGQTNRPVHL